jgi:signal transduction histidine kinase
MFRDDAQVEGGDLACKRWDTEQANVSLQEFQRTGDPFRLFPCHLGLMDMTHIVRIMNRPVALLFSGQYRPTNGIDDILANFVRPNFVHQATRELESRAEATIHLKDLTRHELISLAEELLPMPPDARQRLEREARHIQRFAEGEFIRYKRQKEQDFLDELRWQRSAGPNTFGPNKLASSGVEKLDRQRLQNEIGKMLEKVREFCQCTYSLFFASDQEDDAVLAPLAQSGIPPSLLNHLPHFNWKKAGFQPERAAVRMREFDITSWDMQRILQDGKARGIRGDNSGFFAEAACLVPTLFGARYRGVLVFGPFAEEVDIQEEQRFLIDIANVVGLFALTGLEVLFLEQERRRWKSTATLLTHQLRTALTPITTQIGRARTQLQKKVGGFDAKNTDGFLKQAEDLAILLARGASSAIDGHVLQVESDDLEFERYPLSVLVGNCASGFQEKAREKGVELVVENSVEFLPEAEIDIARLTIALANLIENAVKYSFSGSKIFIRSHINLRSKAEQSTAVVEIDDIGLEILEEERQQIFEQGRRGLVAAKMGHIPGTGLGLWEARAILVAHGGDIQVRTGSTRIYRRGGRAHHIIFSIEIPLRQKHGKEGGSHVQS